MSNALKHQEVLKLKELLADDNRYLQDELQRLSGDEIIGADFGLKTVRFHPHTLLSSYLVREKPPTFPQTL